MPSDSDLLPDDIFSGALRFLEELTAISSPSGDPEGIARAAGLLARALAARGFETAVSWESADGGPELPVLHARGPEAGESPLLLIGHLDTVLPAAAPRREGDRLFATGAIDMKGGLAADRGPRPAHRGGESRRPTCCSSWCRTRRWAAPSPTPRSALGGAGPGALGAGAGGAGGDGAETMVAGRRGMFQWRLERAARRPTPGSTTGRGARPSPRRPAGASRPTPSPARAAAPPSTSAAWWPAMPASSTTWPPRTPSWEPSAS